MVTSDSCSGSREMCTRLRSVSTATLLSWRTSRCPRDRPAGGESRVVDGHGSTASISSADDPVPGAPPSVLLRHRVAGEGEEHVVERRLGERTTSSTSCPPRRGHATIVVASPSPLRTGARRRRPSWLTWIAPSTNGSSVPTALGIGACEGHLRGVPLRSWSELGGRSGGESPGRGR